MTATDNTKVLQVAMSESERRYIKSLAARQGLTLRETILQAFQTWEAQLQMDAGAAGPRPGKSAEGAAELPSQPNRAWLRQAAQLDWSKCPVVELLQGRNRSVWVVRGTLRSLEDVFSAMANGHSFEEITEVYEITPQQLTAILLFAAKRAAPPASGRE